MWKKGVGVVETRLGSSQLTSDVSLCPRRPHQGGAGRGLSSLSVVCLAQPASQPALSTPLLTWWGRILLSLAQRPVTEGSGGLTLQNKQTRAPAVGGMFTSRPILQKCDLSL